jgi:thiol-disulfide isomerase/thioredoxin
MNKFVIIIVSFFIISSSAAQSVKKVKIEELEAYIKNSDHPLVVSFWATWCGPCVREIPWLQEAVAKKQDKKVEFILVSLDFREAFPNKISEFVKQKNFNATHFWLDETNADHFCPKIDAKWEGGIPANLFVNNSTGYHKFFQRQLTDRQAEMEVELLVAGENVK